MYEHNGLFYVMWLRNTFEVSNSCPGVKKVILNLFFSLQVSEVTAL